MADLLDNCRFLAGSMGTADFSDGTADPTFRNLEDAGAEDGKTYPYKAQNATGTEWEIGRGMALNTSGGWILERTTIQDSSDSGNKVNFGTHPKIFITAGKVEIGDVKGPASSVAGNLAVFANTSGKELSDSGITVLDEDDFASDSATAVPTQQSTKAYVVGVLAAANAMVIKGGIDCSGNPNYPAADAGDTYKVTVAGRIGGGSGPVVQVNDAIICTVDSSESGDHATVGANWFIVQSNLEAASTTVPGYVELADVTETDAHSDASRAVTPAGLVNHLKANAENQGPITGGANITPKTLGTITTGTVTVDVGNRLMQSYTNNGDHALAVGTGGTGSAIVLITNGASAGAITTAAFDKVIGDPFTTTNGHKFRCIIERWDSANELLWVEALQ